MKPISFDGLDVEMITQEPAWAAFLEALADFYNENVRPAIGELQDVRDIKETTPEYFIVGALRNAGIEVPFDLIGNKERLFNSVYMVPLLYQTAGTEAAYRAIGYILGRRVSVRTLYTENYQDFYEKPFGPLRIDGGTWYKTTHLNLEMQKIPSDSMVKIPRGSSLRERLLEAFYEFAPINIVVNEFVLNIEASMDPIKICGTVYKHPRRYAYIDESRSTDFSRAVIQGPDEVDAYSTHKFRVISDGIQVETDNWRGIPANSVTADYGEVSFAASDRDYWTTIVAEVAGREIRKDVFVKSIPQFISKVELVGPNVIVSGSSAEYSLLIRHSSGTSMLDADVKVNSPYAVAGGSTVTVSDVDENQEIGLTSTISIGGVEYTASKLVHIQAIDNEVKLTGLSIFGDTNLRENRTYEYRAIALFSDGSSRDVLALWSCTTGAAVLDAGILSTKYVDGNVEFYIEAAYEFRGVKQSAKLKAQIVQSLVELDRLEIIGDSEIPHETSAHFTCVAHYVGGSRTTVTAKW